MTTRVTGQQIFLQAIELQRESNRVYNLLPGEQAAVHNDQIPVLEATLADLQSKVSAVSVTYGMTPELNRAINEQLNASRNIIANIKVHAVVAEISNETQSLFQAFRSLQEADKQKVEIVQNSFGVKPLHPKVATLKTLQDLLPLLGPQAKYQQIDQANTVLRNMKAEAVFRMSGGENKVIGDRPFFHMYRIHNKEMYQCMEYGGKAFAGQFPATNEDRTRCVQRTFVELALRNIEEALNYDGDGILTLSLDLLEGIKLDEQDRLGGRENVALNLYDAFLQMHDAAYKAGECGLADPSDPKFNGSFGRNGFRGDLKEEQLNFMHKFHAVNEVRDALKARWKV